MPKARARWFIRLTNVSMPPGKVRPKAWAARFSLDMRDRCINSPRLSSVPTAKREVLPFSVSTSSWVMRMRSSMGKLASAMTKPVINLVKEAIGKTAWLFLLYSTSWVCWSTTNATLECRPKASEVACKPAI